MNRREFLKSLGVFAAVLTLSRVAVAEEKCIGGFDQIIAEADAVNDKLTYEKYCEGLSKLAKEPIPSGRVGIGTANPKSLLHIVEGKSEYEVGLPIPEGYLRFTYKDVDDIETVYLISMWE